MYTTHDVNMDSVIMNNLFFNLWVSYIYTSHFYIPRIQGLHVERDKKDVGKLKREMGCMWSYLIEYTYEILKNKNVSHTDTEITEALIWVATILIHMNYTTTKTD